MSDQQHAERDAFPLCSQCGERPGAMLKLGTPDLWCLNCLDEAADTPDRDAALRAVLALIETHNRVPITAKELRWAATHEALCRSWIFDVLTGLADALDSATSPGLPPAAEPGQGDGRAEG